MKKRVFSAALAGCMMLTMVPVTAFAAEEGVTEVAVEEYAAEAPSITVAKGTELKNFAAYGKTGESFYTVDGKLAPVVDFYQFDGLVNAAAINSVGKLATCSGYYLPMVVYIPDATENTKFKVVNGYSSDGDTNPDDRSETREYSVSAVADNELGAGTLADALKADKGAKINLVMQVARLDAKVFDREVKIQVSLDGTEAGYGPVQTLFNYKNEISEDMLAKTAKYDTESLKIYTGTGTFTFDGGSKSASTFYSDSTVLKQTGATKGYYLPVCVEVDSPRSKVEINGVDAPVATEGRNHLAKSLVKIADEDGKYVLNEIEAVVYPQGKDGANDHLPHKKVTYSLDDIVLAKEAVTLGATLPDYTKVTSAVANYLAIQNNLKAVKDLQLKDGVLVVTVDKSSLAWTDGDTASEKVIPVLFTLTKDGKPVVASQPKVANYGGVKETHYVVDIDLASYTSADVTMSGAVKAKVSADDKDVKFRVVDASTVPVLNDSATVEVKDGKMIGLTAQKRESAVTTADIKGMYTTNRGSVVITNAAGTRELADADPVGTGCVVVLRDRNRDEVAKFVVVVKGDVLGDGYAHLGQLVAAAQAVKGTASLTGPYLAAGDFNGDGAISLGDLVGMAGMLK